MPESFLRRGDAVLGGDGVTLGVVGVMAAVSAGVPAAAGDRWVAAFVVRGDLFWLGDARAGDLLGDAPGLAALLASGIRFSSTF